MAASPPTLVFVHGFLGFDRLSLPFCEVPYFRGLEKLLRRLAVPYLIPAVGTPPLRLVMSDAQGLAKIGSPPQGFSGMWGGNTLGMMVFVIG